MSTSKANRRTMTARFCQICERSPSMELIVTYNESMERQSLTMKEGYTLATRFAHMLRCQGIQRGDVVTSTLPLSLEAAVVNFGIILAGAVAMTVDVVSQSGEELFHAINKSESKLVIVRSDTDDKAWEGMKPGIQAGQNGFVRNFSMPRIPSVNHVVVANRENRDDNGDSFLDHLRKQLPTFLDDDVDEKDQCMVFLTSGTTGFPKLAKYTHVGLVENADSGKASLKIDAHSKYYVTASWSWGVAAPVDTLWSLTRVSPDLWHPLKEQIKFHASLLKKENVRSCLMSPISALSIYDAYTDGRRDVCIFDQLSVAGVPLNQTMAEGLLKAAKVLTVRYGCTENITISFTHIEKSTEVIEYDCGYPYPGSECRVVDENFQDVAEGDPGLILVKTVGAFDGYLNDPVKTTKATTADGWYNSSDAGYIRTENKHLMVIGRYDYLIKHASSHYFPAWIERPIREHPEVQEVVVIPVPHERNYQNICACVIRKPGSNLSASDVQDIIRNAPPQDGRRLMPPQHVLFYEKFPGNARGKIVMNKLIEDATSAVKKQEFDIVRNQVH